MKVSIIIPCFNQAEFLEESVTSALKQTYTDIEIIIVNDGSTDSTSEIAQKIERENPIVELIETGNNGLAAARNRGIKQAQGELILPLDSDDIIYPTYVEKAVEAFKRQRDLSIVYCNAEFFGGKSGQWKLDPFSLDRMLESNIIFCSGLFWKKDWKEVGGYDETFRSGWEDWDFWLRIIQLRNAVLKLDEVLFKYRVKDVSMIKGMNQSVEIDLRNTVFKKYQNFYNENFRNPIQMAVEYRALKHKYDVCNDEVEKFKIEARDLRAQLKETRGIKNLLRLLWKALRNKFL